MSLINNLKNRLSLSEKIQVYSAVLSKQAIVDYWVSAHRLNMQSFSRENKKKTDNTNR